MKIGSLVRDTSDGCLLIYLGKEMGGPSLAPYRFMELESGHFWSYDRLDVQTYIEVISENR